MTMTELDLDAQRFALETCSRLREQDYLFTVTVGTAWDVYKFDSPRGSGTVAFRKVDDKFEIGFFRRGSFTQEEVARTLAQDAPT